MKKSILSLSISAILALGLTACVDDGDDGISGVDGVDGINGVDGTDGTDGVAGTDGVDGADGTSINIVPGLKRLATAPLGAEFTGMYLNDDGTFFLNVQHPSTSNTTADGSGNVYNKGTVGVIVGHNFSQQDWSAASLDLPITTADKEVVKTAVGRYQVLAQQEDATTNAAVTARMGDIITADGATLIASSDDPDFNGVVPGNNAGEYYLYTNWEYRPGGMSRILLDGYTQNNGYGSIVKEGMLDFSDVDGTWVNCFGTVSPWGTMLSAEELYFDDTADWFDAANSRPQSLAAYLGYPTDGSGAWPNPYRYGYNVEVGADPLGGTAYTTTAPSLANVAVNKQTTMGRFSHENAVVMPDQKTVFLSDDGTDVVFFKFVADAPADMSSGTLYGAKVTQAADVKDPAAAAFAIEWIELGSGNETDIESWIAEYDTATVASPSYITDQQVNDWAEAKLSQDLDGSGSIATSPFADERPAFLESRKAAAALGATAEFRKMEGVNINYGLASTWWNAGAADGAQAYMYMAMSSFDAGMSDDAGDIQLDGTNGRCGVVYRMKLERNAAGDVDVSTMVPAIVGGPYYPDNAVNECSVNSISNPDNLVILDDGRVLIGEDTGNHENNVIWLFDDPAI